MEAEAEVGAEAGAVLPGSGLTHEQGTSKEPAKAGHTWQEAGGGAAVGPRGMSARLQSGHFC